MKNYLLLFFILCFSSMTAQTVYETVYEGNGYEEVNGNNSFSGTSTDSGAVGDSTLKISDTNGTIEFTFTKGDADFDHMLVIYISTGAAGRAVIDGDVNDTADDFREAISSPEHTITFHKGFQATHAIAIKAGSGNNVRLYSIPATGTISNGDLNSEDDDIGNPVNATQASFTFSFPWNELGSSTDSFRFVATYVDIATSSKETSNEGYGGDFMEVTGQKITGSANISDDYVILNSYTYPSPNKNEEILYNDLYEYFNPFNRKSADFAYAGDQIASWGFASTSHTNTNQYFGSRAIFDNQDNSSHFELSKLSFIISNWDDEINGQYEHPFTLHLLKVNEVGTNPVDPQKGDTIASITKNIIIPEKENLSIRNAAYTGSQGSAFLATFDLDDLVVDVDQLIYLIELEMVADGEAIPPHNDGLDNRLDQINMATYSYDGTAFNDYSCYDGSIHSTPTTGDSGLDYMYTIMTPAFTQYFPNCPIDDKFRANAVPARISGTSTTVIEWTGGDPNNNNFNDPDNWSGGSVPGVTNTADLPTEDNAVIPAGTPTAVIPDGSTRYLKNLNVDGTLEVRGTLAVSNNLANYGQVTFKSGDGYTGQLGETGNIRGTGEFTVERYVPKRRAFRYIGSPVNTTGTINDNLQEGATTASTPSNPEPTYGTHITGGSIADGFDQSTSNKPSMFEWNETIQDWDAISSANQRSTNKQGDKMAVGDAYALMVRGDRTTALDDNSEGPATTLRFTGDLVAGEFDAPDLSATDNDFNLVANPYQAYVDMKALYNSTDFEDLNQYIFVYNPHLGTQGGYETIDLFSDLSSIPSGDADENIPPNQAFFIQTEGNSPVLTFKETYKNTDAYLVDTFSDDNSSVMNINLHRQPQDVLVDGVSARFDPGHNNAVNNSDAVKVWNFDEMVALFSSNNYLSIEKRAMPVENDELQIYTGNYQSDNYVWNVDISNIDREAVLYDAYNDQDHPLNANATTNIAFTVDENIPGTVDPYRFRIVFQEETLSDENFEPQEVRIYPNPVDNGKFNIQGLPQLAGDESVNLTIYDLLGKQVYQKTLNNVQATEVISVEKLNAGSYILELNTSNNTLNYNLLVK